MIEGVNDRQAVIVTRNAEVFEPCRDYQSEQWRIAIQPSIAHEDSWDVVFYVYDPHEADDFMTSFADSFPIIIVTDGDVADEVLRMSKYTLRGCIRSKYLIEKGADILRQMDVTSFVVAPEDNYLFAERLEQQRENYRQIVKFDLMPELLPGAITNDEARTLQELLNGNDTEAIAMKRHYSKSTINSQVSSLIKKFELEDRTQLVVEVIRRGWVRSFK